MPTKIDTLITFAADCITLNREDAMYLLQLCGHKEATVLNMLRDFIQIDSSRECLLHLERDHAKQYLKVLVT